MQRYILVAVLFTMLLSTGCSENNKESREITLSNLEKTIAEKHGLEEKLNNTNLKIQELEKQISNLKEKLEEQDEQKIEKDDSTSYNVLRIIDVNEKELRYVLEKTSIPSQTVSIVGSNIEDLVEEYEEIRIKGQGSGEYFRTEVIGSIYDFQLIKLEWNDEANKFLEVKVMHELDEVRNQTIYIETFLPCGMPSEKIKWKDSKGDRHEVILANDGYGFDGSIIWSK
ncbi:hypothetical protein R9X47_19765 [Wukongibacter baidiensis]|uniref:hypothetical protein n=1 Tax=Wukongibacter baidiensis TaxID=1723361 RepID=UPI003D7F7139